MGLDIAFNREQALAAGLEVFKETRGLQEDIDAALAEVELDYADWLKSEGEYVRIPGTDRVVENDGLDRIIVRANKWGHNYAPLTHWLRANNIEWTEF